MIDFEKLKAILTENNSFLLTTHVNPDADAIGSELALYFILKKLNKNLFIVNHSATPYNLEFLDKEKQIQKYDAAKHDKLFEEVDVIICLDFNRSNRLARMQSAFLSSKKLKVCIDHHQDSENFTDYVFVDRNYCATGHIIYDLIKKTGIVDLDHDIAYQIYAAIMTDTGSFRFERTTPELHRLTAELLELNVDPSEVFDKIYDHSKYSKIKLLGKALDSLTLYGNGNKIGYMILRRKEFEETGAIESDTDGFVNFSLSVESVCLGILFIELNEGFKVSFRSKGEIPVNKLAAEFGGGGHTNASGARFFSENLDEFIDKILSRAEKYIA